MDGRALSNASHGPESTFRPASRNQVTGPATYSSLHLRRPRRTSRPTPIRAQCDRPSARTPPVEYRCRESGPGAGHSAASKVRASEAASKEAFRQYCAEHGWQVAFFEGRTGSPRTGIIDGVAFRLGRSNADALEMRPVQLKGGRAGVSGAEIGRLKKAVTDVNVDWLIAAFDGQALQLVPDLPLRARRQRRV